MASVNGKPTVVGLYGVPGSGKTYLLNQLRNTLDINKFAFYDGSQTIGEIVPGGLEAFKKLGHEGRQRWRECAIDTIRADCVHGQRAGVVAGHFMFWSEPGGPTPAYTKRDLEIYSHIIYLEVPVATIVEQRSRDTERSRSPVSTMYLDTWQKTEKHELQRVCREHGMLYLTVQPGDSHERITALLHDFEVHSASYNLRLAKKLVDEAIDNGQKHLETMLVFDADKTLAPEDSGGLFWQKLAAATSKAPAAEMDPLKTLFSSRLGYSHTAFRQSVLLYEEAANDNEFEALCQEVASTVTMHPEFVAMLMLAAETDHVGSIIVTCGLRRVWQIVLEREGLSSAVSVIGGGRIADGIVVTAAVKTALVTHLRDVHKANVCAFGDSTLDLAMLSTADQAFVVVCSERTRSKSMAVALQHAIDIEGLHAHQILLPSSVSPRVDTTKLPVVKLTESDFISTILDRHIGLRVFHATERSAAKLLMTPMRDATTSGTMLREAHRHVGWYLATEFLSDITGLEECSIPHVQGHQTTGHRLRGEVRTSIVALMRGGEPMAFGVSEAFPLASFVHAKKPEDLTLDHVDGLRTIILVDSVVNSGKTVIEFVQHIRMLSRALRIVVVAVVAQSQSVKGGSLSDALAETANVSLIALRLSDNKFTGKGSTDTGNRLFNTTHMP